MFSVVPEKFFVRIFAGCFLFSMFALSSAVLNPALLLAPAIIFILFLVWWSVDCAFRTESFSKYVTLRMFYSLSLPPALAFALLLALMHKELKSTSLFAVVVSCVPLVITAILYFLVRAFYDHKCTLVVCGQRVEIKEVEPKNQAVLAGVLAAIGGLLFPVFQLYEVAYSLLVIALIGASLYMVLWNRANISALRALKEQEVRARCHYTFMNIEEIREKRAASLIGRLFASKAGR